MKIGRTLLFLCLGLWSATTAWADSLSLPVDVYGFAETRSGVRVSSDEHQKETSLLEARLQTDATLDLIDYIFKLKADFIYDDLADDHAVQLEDGDGWIDLREANFFFYPFSSTDLKIGRQILTWGTGDLIFINDLFPKDWISFFTGRDVEYLKAPSDALRVSFYHDMANMELVYTPRFDSDRFITGERISYWNDSLMDIAGRNAIVKVQKPDQWFEDDEVALRIFKNISGTEIAFYGYSGYWKSPAGQDALTGQAVFPELNVYGASVRGQIANGIGKVEIGYYDSREDSDGENPFIRNGEWRFLAGYEREIVKDLTAGLQYYLERMQDYDSYRQTLPAGLPEKDEDRHVVTLRLTRLAMKQTLTLSLFVFYSPTDEDSYWRPKVSYKFTDDILGEVGGSVFSGQEKHTFFGQFEKNSNIYAAVRYSF